MHINKTELLQWTFLVAGIAAGMLLTEISHTSQELRISDLCKQNKNLQTENSMFKSERLKIARNILAPESFHILEPDVINVRFSGFMGELVWFTQDNGISYAQLNRENDPGVEVSDGKVIIKPEQATAFMIKRTSSNGFKITYEGK